MSDASTPVGLSLNEIRRRVGQFAHDYRDAARESAMSQPFWAALLRCFGIQTPHQHGIEFEYRARRASTGNTGEIDVFQPAITSGDYRRDGFLAEQKSAGGIRIPRGRSRSNAEEQAQDYLDGGSIPAHQMPRWVIISDFRNIQITDRSRPVAATGRTVTFMLEDFPEHIDDFLWL